MRVDIRKLANFTEGAGYNTSGEYQRIVQGVDFTSKQFQVAIPVTDLTYAQLEALKSAEEYAQSFGITFNVVMIGK